MEHEYQRGDIHYANLGKTDGSVQSGFRPILIVQNNWGNRYSPTIIAAPITSKIEKRDFQYICRSGQRRDCVRHQLFCLSSFVPLINEI